MQIFFQQEQQKDNNSCSENINSAWTISVAAKSQKMLNTGPHGPLKVVYAVKMVITSSRAVMISSYDQP